MKNWHKAFTYFAHFEPIPFSEMGLYVDEHRREVQNAHRNWAYLINLTQDGGGYNVEDKNEYIKFQQK